MAPAPEPPCRRSRGARRPRGPQPRRRRGGHRPWAATLYAAAALLPAPCAARSWHPAWADPQNYEGIQEKQVYVSQLQQSIQVLERKYHYGTARMRCDAIVTEELEFDFSPPRKDMLLPRWELAHRPEDRPPFHGGAVRQYYLTGKSQMLLERLQMLDGAAGITHKETAVLQAGPMGNRTFQLLFNFTPPSRARISVRIRLRVINFMESRTDYNLIHWRPYGPIWEGPRGAFVANATFEVHLPFGLKAREDHPIPHRVPRGKGFNIYTNIRNPLPDEFWEEDSVTIRIIYDLWISEWDRLSNELTGPGHEPMRIDMLFDQQQKRCGEFPYWIYIVSFGAVITFIFFSASIVGYCYFERPWDSLADVNPFASRKRMLASMRRVREEEQRQQQALAQVTRY